jgi:hypothetical protein
LLAKTPASATSLAAMFIGRAKIKHANKHLNIITSTYGVVLFLFHFASSCFSVSY